MKKFSFLALAAAGMLFAACSSDKDVAGETPSVSADGNGFVGISISIPSADGTRANDDLTNGKNDEFAVKNAYLYLFVGSDASNAKFVKRYSITDSFDPDNQGQSPTPTPQDGVTLPGGTAITSTAVAVCKVDNLELGNGEHLFAFVAVNAQGALANAPAKNTPFSTFGEEPLDEEDRGGDLDGNIGDLGLLMTNSPISDQPRGSAAPATPAVNHSTLVQLNDDAIKTSREAAEQAPAGCIYVERAAAKVTIANDIASDDSHIDMAGTNLSFEIVGWQVINTEPEFYTTRQVLADWNDLFSEYWTGKTTTYRFISAYPFAPTVGDNHTTGYRTYFAKDLQYDKEATLEHTVAGETGRKWLGLTDRAFVPENTFDVERQTHKNTTQVTLKVKFNGGTDFYTISDDAHFYLSSTVGAAIVAKVEDLYNVAQAKKKLAQAEADKLATGSTDKYRATVTLTAAITDDSEGSDNVAYTVSYTMTAEKSTDNGATWTSCSTVALTEAEETTAGWLGTNGAKAEAEAALTVALYKGGMSYYNVRIQHFGTQETPWSPTGTYITKPGSGPNGEYTISDIYGTDATARTNNFLGRWGVVRDNWYHLSINGIAKLGSAEPKPVDADTTPDDEVEDQYYISAHVHILPWVLRLQSVDL